jgi:alpha-L-fucosidase
VQRLKEIGQWLQQNGGAIYGTRTAAHYQDGNTYFTKSKSDETYALVCLTEDKPLPQQVEWKGNLPAKGTKVKLLSNGATVKWKREGDKVVVTLPSSFVKEHKSYAALAFAYRSE